MFKSGAAFAGAAGGSRFDDVAHEFTSVLGVLGEIANDLVDGDGVVLFVPTIVIGDHGHSDIADFGFAGEFGFLKISHTDDVHAPASINVGFGARREGGAFHAEISTAEFAGDADLLRAGVSGGGELRADGIREADVRDNAVAKEGGNTTPGTIEKLIWDHEIEGFVFDLHGADGAE